MEVQVLIQSKLILLLPKGPHSNSPDLIELSQSPFQHRLLALET
jgi:hypothetical protein